jgi:UDP-N-acetyl-D-glucosamine dehydrogenase
MTPEFLLDVPARQPAQSTEELPAEAHLGEPESTQGHLGETRAERPAVTLLRDTPVEAPTKLTAESLLKTPVKEAAKGSFEFLRDTPVKEAARSSFEFLRDTPVKEAARSSFEFLRGAPAEDVADHRVELLRDAPDERDVEVSVQLLRDMPDEEVADGRVELLRDAPDERDVEVSVQLLRDMPAEEPIEDGVEALRDAPGSAESLVEVPVEDPIEDAEDLWEGQSPWETAAGGVRITREAPAEPAFVAVVGLGHGLSSAMALRRAGLRVLGIDTSAGRLNDIRSGRTETLGVNGEELRAYLHDEDFVLSDELEMVRSASSVLICVPAILDAQQHPSLEALRRTCATVVAHARAGQTLVLTSTSHIGCTRELLVEPLAQRGLRAGEEVFVAFSPERSERHTDDQERARAPRVVGAVSERCFAHASGVLRHVCQDLHRVSAPETAEMVKLYESTFRAVNVALAFEMADACRVAHLDPVEVTAAAAANRSGFMAHHPSAGVGGYSVGVDPHCLLHPLREKGRPALLAEEAMRTIAARPRRVAMRAHELLQRSGQRLRDMRVLVVGAAYKPGVADCAGSPGVEIMSWLAAEGVPVEYHDPLVPVLYVDDEPLQSIDPDPRRDASGFGPEDYDLVIVVTIQPGHDYGWLRRCPQVLDCTYTEPTGRRCLQP